MAIDIQFANVPPEQAIDFLNNKGYETSFSWQDMAGEANRTAFTAAKVMEMDVLVDIREHVQNGLAQGIPFEQVMKELQPRLAQKGWWGDVDVIDPKTGQTQKVTFNNHRLKRIYDTNLATAYHEGQWQRIQDKRRVFTHLKYSGCNSQEPRKDHCQWDGLILPVDDPWWRHHFPVRAWGCKCDVQQLTKRQAERQGVSDTPKEEYVEWENTRTGEKQKIPLGVDPAFNYPPGGSEAALKEIEKEKKKKLPKEIQKALEEEKPVEKYWDTATETGAWHDVAFANAPEWLKKAVKKAGEVNVIYDEESPSYWPSSKRIEMHDYKDRKNTRYQGTWAHEFGHHIDFQIFFKDGLARSSRGDFVNRRAKDGKLLMKFDKSKYYQEYKEMSEKIKGEFNKRKIVRELFAELGLNYTDVESAIMKHSMIDSTYFSTEEKYTTLALMALALKNKDARAYLNLFEGLRYDHPRVFDKRKYIEATISNATYDKGISGKISDLISATTKKEIEGKGAHSREYFAQKGNKETECFANLTAVYADGNPFLIFVVETFTPNMNELFKKIIGEYTNE